MSKANTLLADILVRVTADAGAELSAADVLNSLGTPPDPEMGDISFPCFPLAKALRNAPPRIAGSLLEPLNKALAEHDEFDRATQAGPYLNVHLNQAHRASTLLRAALVAGYGGSSEGAGKVIGIDYSSPNIAKPFGIGHLRSTSIGNALRNIFTRRGYDVVGVNHLGDWGTQFGKLMAAFERWGDRDQLEQDPIQHLYELYVRFHKEAEAEEALLDEGRAWFRKLEAGDAQATAYWEEFRSLSLVAFNAIYERLGVSFDHFWGEAFYNDMLDDVVKDVEASGQAEISDGALVVKMDELELPPCLIRKSDGATLYATRDLAAARYRQEELGFEQFLYVVGAEQIVHFRQVFEVLRRMGYEWADRLHHVTFGRIQGISTRKGTLVFLEDILERGRARVAEILKDKPFDDAEREEVIEQVTVGAILFYDLSRNRIKNYDFDWDLMLRGLGPDERGQTGPYLQYTHTRLKSLEDTFEERYGELKPVDQLDFAAVSDAAARPVLVELEKYPNAIAQAAENYEPAVISRFAIDLAEAFNSFYSGGNRVVSDDETLSHARTALVRAVRMTLADALTVLGVPLPNRM